MHTLLKQKTELHNRINDVCNCDFIWFTHWSVILIQIPSDTHILTLRLRPFTCAFHHSTISNRVPSQFQLRNSTDFPHLCQEIFPDQRDRLRPRFYVIFSSLLHLLHWIFPFPFWLYIYCISFFIRFYSHLFITLLPTLLQEVMLCFVAVSVFICLSVSSITAKAITQFHWNLTLWLGRPYQSEKLINFRWWSVPKYGFSITITQLSG